MARDHIPWYEDLEDSERYANWLLILTDTVCVVIGRAKLNGSSLSFNDLWKCRELEGYSEREIHEALNFLARLGYLEGVR